MAPTPIAKIKPKQIELSQDEIKLLKALSKFGDSVRIYDTEFSTALSLQNKGFLHIEFGAYHRFAGLTEQGYKLSKEIDLILYRHKKPW